MYILRYDTPDVIENATVDCHRQARYLSFEQQFGKIQLHEQLREDRYIYRAVEDACHQLSSMLEAHKLFPEIDAEREADAITSVLVREIRTERVLLQRCVQVFQSRQLEPEPRPVPPVLAEPLARLRGQVAREDEEQLGSPVLAGGEDGMWPRSHQDVLQQQRPPAGEFGLAGALDDTAAGSGVSGFGNFASGAYSDYGAVFGNAGAFAGGGADAYGGGGGAGASRDVYPGGLGNAMYSGYSGLGNDAAASLSATAAALSSAQAGHVPKATAASAAISAGGGVGFTSGGGASFRDGMTYNGDGVAQAGEIGSDRADAYARAAAEQELSSRNDVSRSAVWPKVERGPGAAVGEGEGTGGAAATSEPVFTSMVDRSQVDQLLRRLQQGASLF